MSMVDHYEITKILLECGAIKLNLDKKFVWASGIHSPIYCDNRVILSYPKQRDTIASAVAREIRRNFSNVNAIVGVATAGIPVGVLVAQKLNIAYAYCRTEPKKHGAKKQLEGTLKENSQLVVFEDLISTGKSSLKVVDYLKSNHHNVLGVQAIFTYGTKMATKNFREHNTKIETLINARQLIEAASNNGYISSDEARMVLSFLKTL